MAAGIVLLMAAWALGDPPGAVPDEAAHLVKALGTARLQFAGNPPSVPARTPAASTVRSFVVPSLLVDASFGCNRFYAATSSGCLRDGGASTSHDIAVETQVGSYPPLVYLLPGLAGLFAHGALQAMWLGRAANVLVDALLVILALRALNRRSPAGPAVAGVLLALTPMSLFLAASINSSGIEVISGVTLVAVVVAASRRGEGLAAHPGALLVTGVAVALSRPLGPAWLAMAAVIYLVLRESDQRPATPGSRPKVAVVLATLGAAAISTVLWPRVTGAAVATAGIHPGAAAMAVWRMAPAQLIQVIGTFGWVDTPMPSYMVATWYLLVGGLVLLAGWHSRPGVRLLLVGLPLAAAVVAVGVQAIFTAPSGNDIQARYVMVPILAIPVVAGELCRRAAVISGSRLARPGTSLVLVLTTAMQVAALVINARREATGIHVPIRAFVMRAEWVPPGGWWAWLALVALAAAVLLVSLVPARPAEDPGPVSV